MTQWRKSSRSATSDNTDCVEVARMASTIGVRDSKNPDGPRLALSPDAWRTLVEQLKHDDTP